MSAEINVVASMADCNRGIWKGCCKPWKYICGEENFKAECLVWRTHMSKKVMCIWDKDNWCHEYKSFKCMANTINVVVACDYNADDDPCCSKVCPTFSEALEYSSSEECCELDCIWVCGGAKMYEEAICHKKCKYIYITRVMKDCEADCFFPRFEHKFKRVNDCKIPNHVYTEEGIPYKHEAWKNMDDDDDDDM